MKVRKPTLLIVAGIVWFAAGVNILRIGIQSSVTLGTEGKYVSLLIALGAALLVFTGFFFMFRKVVNKHCHRILSYPEEKKNVFLFFDLKGYLLMTFMMALGITLRVFAKLPTAFFAAFYSGLGTALSIGGIRFILARIKVGRSSNQDKTKDVENPQE